VKLLFDENLSPKLPKLLAEVYPGSTHVKDCALNKASDLEVWEFAKAQGFAIVSKDSDFEERSMLWGSPPKVIWLRIPNCSSLEVAEILRNSLEDIHRFAEQESAKCLELGK
jgi:predicted nuclease of predicted toxin-antitoxin system